ASSNVAAAPPAIAVAQGRFTWPPLVESTGFAGFASAAHASVTGHLRSSSKPRGAVHRPDSQKEDLTVRTTSIHSSWTLSTRMYVSSVRIEDFDGTDRNL